MVITKEKAFTLAETLLTMAIICLLVAVSMKIFTGKHNKIKFNSTHGYFMCYIRDGQIYQKLNNNDAVLAADQNKGCEFVPISSVTYYIINSIGGGSGGTDTTEGNSGSFDSSYYSALANNLYIMPGRGGGLGSNGESTTITPEDTNKVLKNDYTKEVSGGYTKTDGSIIRNNDKSHAAYLTQPLTLRNISHLETLTDKNKDTVSVSTPADNKSYDITYSPQAGYNGVAYMGEKILNKLYAKYKTASFPTDYDITTPELKHYGNYSDDKFWNVENGEIIYYDSSTYNYDSCPLKPNSKYIWQDFSDDEIENIFKYCKLRYVPVSTQDTSRNVPLYYYKYNEDKSSGSWGEVAVSRGYSKTLASEDLTPKNTDYGYNIYRSANLQDGYGSYPSNVIIRLNYDISYLMGRNTNDMMEMVIRASGHNNGDITYVLNSHPGHGGEIGNSGSNGLVYITW